MVRTRRQQLGIAIALAGLGCLVLGAWTLAQLRVSLARGPMLLSPFAMAVVRDGSVLVGVDASRVHVYDPEGRFLRSWPVSDAEGRFRLRATPGERVLVATDSGLRLEFDLAGNLATRTRDARAYDHFGPENDFQASGASGAHYSIETGALVRLHPAPEALLVPPLRRPLAWFVDALPALGLLMGVGAVAIFGGIALTSRSREAP